MCSTHSSNEGSDESTKEASSSGTYEEAPKETLPSADSAADLLQDVVEEQQLNSAEQQLNSEEQQLNAEEQQLNAEEQQLKDENIRYDTSHTLSCTYISSQFSVFNNSTRKWTCMPSK